MYRLRNCWIPILILLLLSTLLLTGCHVLEGESAEGQPIVQSAEEQSSVSAEASYWNENPPIIPESHDYAIKALETIENVVNGQEDGIFPDNIYFTDFNLDGTLELVIDYGMEGLVFHWKGSEYELVDDAYQYQFLSLYYNSETEQYVFVSQTTTGDTNFVTRTCEQTFDGKGFQYRTVFSFTGGTDEIGEIQGQYFLSDDTEVTVDEYNTRFQEYYESLDDAKLYTYNIMGGEFVSLTTEEKYAELQKSFSSFSYKTFN